MQAGHVLAQHRTGHHGPGRVPGAQGHDVEVCHTAADTSDAFPPAPFEGGLRLEFSGPLPPWGTMQLVPTLVLLRHGQSTWNLKNLFTGWVDADLSDLGREEARRGGH